MFTFNVDGLEIEIYVSSHAAQRMRQRRVNRYAVFSSIMAAADHFLDLKNGSEFCIKDKELQISIVCALHTDGFDISVEVITVFDSDHFYEKEGTTVVDL